MPCYSCVSYVLVFSMSLVAVLTTLFLVFHMSSRSADPRLGEPVVVDETEEEQSWVNFLREVIDIYGYRTGKWCFTTICSLYTRFTPINTVIFLLKYIPTGLYMYKMLKAIFLTSRERIKQKQMELEDIKLQIQIVNTKLYVRDAEFEERVEKLRRCSERLRVVREKVREIISADDTLRRVLNPMQPPTSNVGSTRPPEEDSQYVVELLKELNAESELEQKQHEKMDCGEHANREDSVSGNSVYSSLSDSDTKHDCRVKIVKVTNVYKVSCLKHYIKQKKLRRATQQALLEKKIKSIKKLLESWQKSLNTVINSKLLLDSSPMDLASQEAMGDYTKRIRDSSDSDSDLKESDNTCYDEYSLNWTQNPYRPFTYNYEELTESAMAKEYYEQEINQELKIPTHPAHLCDGTSPKCSPNILFILPEETSSQVAIEEIKSDASVES